MKKYGYFCTTRNNVTWGGDSNDLEDAFNIVEKYKKFKDSLEFEVMCVQHVLDKDGNEVNGPMVFYCRNDFGKLIFGGKDEKAVERLKKILA